MKIAIIGGLGSHLTVKWANALAARGSNITVFAYPEDNKYADLLNGDISKQYLSVSYSAGGLKKNVKELKGMLHAGKFDVVNVFDAVKYGFLALKASDKYLVTLAGPDVYAALDGTSKSLFVKVIKKACGVIAPSNAAIDDIKTKLYTKEQNYYKVSPGVDVQKFNVLDVPKYEKVTFGSFKALEPYNNIAFAINAFEKLSNEIEGEIEFLIYGDGSEKAALMHIVESKGLSDKVKFMGVIAPDEVPQAMNKLTALISAANHDIFGVSTIEGMACAVPTVATDTPGASEIILNGVTGSAVKVGKIDPLVYCLKDFANYPQNAQKMGENARPDIVELYEINACTSEYLKVLNSVK